MKPIVNSALIFSMMVSGFGSPVFAAPEDRNVAKATVTRKVGDPLQKTQILKKNFYRTETYEENYQVSVPYQATETYYENVPYEIDEPYQDIEYYDEREHVCRNRTTYRRECRTERVCNAPMIGSFLMKLLIPEAEAQFNGPGGGMGGGIGGGDGNRPGRPGPGWGGGNPRPDNPRPDHPRPPRPDEPRPPRPDWPRPDEPRPPRPDHPRPDHPRPPRPDHPRPDHPRPPRPDWPRPDEPRPPRPRPPHCREQQVCRDIPETRRECNWENVRRSRTVTRYRRVTRYRQEERTRTVTRYRQETRCCVTKTREVLDRSWQVQIALNFPEASALQGKEQETFEILLTGDETAPIVNVTGLNTVFAYAPVVNVINANQIEVAMNVVPKYTSVELGQGSLQSLMVVSSKGRNYLLIQDSGARARVFTQYTAQISDLASSAQIARVQWIDDGRTQNLEKELGSALPVGQLVRLQIAVQRQSVLLDQSVTFTQDLQIAIEPDQNFDVAPYVDPNQTGKFSLSGSGAKTALRFRDLTKDIPQVQTQYEFSITESSGSVIAAKTFDRKNVMLEDGRLVLRFKEDFGLDDDALAKLRSGKTLIINYKAIRSGRKFSPNPTVIAKKVTLAIP